MQAWNNVSAQVIASSLGSPHASFCKVSVYLHPAAASLKTRPRQSSHAAITSIPASPQSSAQSLRLQTGRTITRTEIMPLDDWRKNFNKKLDDFGEDAKLKFRQQREANAGGSSAAGDRVGLQDRMNMLKGENPRWNRDVDSRTSAAGAGAEHNSTVVPERSRVPPAPPSALNKGRPPPPPTRHSATGSVASVGLSSGPAPSLPPRMQNEDGTSNPPPPYPPTQHSYPTSEGAGHIEFSRFTRQDKAAFFELLDEVGIICFVLRFLVCYLY